MAGDTMKRIPLTKGLFTLVDDYTYASIGHLKWYSHKGRAIRKEQYGPATFLHHTIVGYPLNGLEVDHINRNPLDNRRRNLRIVTRKENQNNLGVRRDNKAGIRGLYWGNDRKKWRLQYKHKHVKDFKTLKAAKKWILEHYGQLSMRFESQQKPN